MLNFWLHVLVVLMKGPILIIELHNSETKFRERADTLKLNLDQQLTCLNVTTAKFFPSSFAERTTFWTIPFSVCFSLIL